jgi:aminopeptidase YwaD
VPNVYTAPQEVTHMVATKYQDYMFGLITKVIDEIGPRPSCSEAEKKLGRLLVEQWKPICDKVDVEPFTCSPTAHLGSLYILVLFYFAAVVLYWFLPPLALVLATINCSIVFLEIFRYREFVDLLFPRKQGENVVGTIQPRDKPTQRVIVSGHMDSAYEFNLFLYFKSASIPLLVIAIVAQVIALGACLAKTVAYFNVYSNDSALTGVGIAMIAAAPIAGLFLFFTSWRPVPGACDDMSGVSVVAGLGRLLGEARGRGDWFPERTEVVLLATSTEENGLRGAKRYVRGHLKQVKAMPTYCLNLDGVKDENFIEVLKGESSTGARHDLQLVRIAQDVAASHGWRIAVKQMEPLFATDATPFSLNGIHATCLYCADSSTWDPTYHTRYDTSEHIRPESLSVMLQLVVEMIQRIDKGEMM